MGSYAQIAGYVAEPAFARTQRNAKTVAIATRPVFASTISGRVNVGNATEPPFAITTSGAIIAVSATVPRSVRTARTARNAPNVNIFHAPFKGAYNLAIALAAHKIY